MREFGHRRRRGRDRRERRQRRVLDRQRREIHALAGRGRHDLDRAVAAPAPRETDRYEDLVERLRHGRAQRALRADRSRDAFGAVDDRHVREQREAFQTAQQRPVFESDVVDRLGLAGGERSQRDDGGEQASEAAQAGLPHRMT